MRNHTAPAISESDTLDALAFVFERKGAGDLADLRRYRAHWRVVNAEAKPLEGKALEEACRGAMMAALARLRERFPEASEQEAQDAISSVVDAPAPSVLLGQTVDIAQLIEDGVPEPVFLPSPSLGQKLYQAHTVSVTAGHKKGGKSWAETVQAADLLRAKRHVVYVDHENGVEVFAERLQSLKVSATQTRGYFHYVPFPRELPALDGLRHEFEQIAVRWPDCLVVIDSLRSMMTRYGLKSNEDTEVEKLLGPLMGAVKNRPAESRLTVKIIDHSNRSTKDGDAYAAAGSFAKACGVDSVYYFEKIEEFSVAQQGLVKISVVDDRRGRLAGIKRHYRVGGQGEGKPITFELASNDEVGTIGRIRTEVEVFLTDQPKQLFTLTALREAKSIKGNDMMIAKAVELLVASDRNIHKDANPARKGSCVYSFDPDRDSGHGDAGIGL